MAQQTAVDWLFEQLWETPIDKLTWYAILEQAKQIERQQLANSWDKACDQYIYRDGNLVKVWADFDKYYNETYGSNNQI